MFGPFKKRPPKPTNINAKIVKEVIDILKIKQKNLLNRIGRRKAERPLSANERRSSNTSKVILRFNDDAIPPLGHYRPDYNYVKPRVSSTCFYKSSERKTIFAFKKPEEKSIKKLKRVMSATRRPKKPEKLLSCPRTGIISRRGISPS
mmetsp:Transcript_23250/g.20619  ORF Transcript_23250/g.20619 Transcript_23250/m.20619 type:complete len:148 (+) Transcript_23250:145-588(+)